MNPHPISFPLPFPLVLSPFLSCACVPLLFLSLYLLFLMVPHAYAGCPYCERVYIMHCNQDCDGGPDQTSNIKVAEEANCEAITET